MLKNLQQYMQNPQNYPKHPPNIIQSLARAFQQQQNTLVLHSKSLDITRSLALSLYQSIQTHLTLLIDFPEQQLSQINFHLHQLKNQYQILRTDIRGDTPQIVALNKMTREKRRKCYIEGGIYGLSTQVVLMDLLSETAEIVEGGGLNAGLVGRVVIRDGEYGFGDKYGLNVWICTLLSMSDCKSVITVVSNKIVQFKGDNLQKIYRLLYMKKLVLWPFGRSQIHQSLQTSPLPTRTHKLPLNPTEHTLHQNYLKLLKHAQKSKSPTLTSKNDQKSIEYLYNCLLNCSKLDYLVRLEAIACGEEISQYGIWKSNSTNVIEVVDGIVVGSRRCVFGVVKMEGNKEQMQRVEKQQGQRQGIDVEIVQQNQVINKIPRQSKQQELPGRVIDLNSLLPYIEGDKTNPQLQIPNIQILMNCPPQLKPSVNTMSSQPNPETQSFHPNSNSNPNPDKISNPLNKCPYTLNYQLHVPGLKNTEQYRIEDIARSPLFPVKLVEIIREIHENYNVGQEKQQNQETKGVSQQESQLLEMVQRSVIKNNRKNENKGDDYDNLMKQVRKSQQDQYIRLQNTQNKSNSDFSQYEFKILKTNKKQTHPQTQNPKTAQINPNQNPHSPPDPIPTPKHSEIDPNPTNSHSSSLSVQQKPRTLPQTTTHICTPSQQVSKQLHYLLYCYQNQFHYIAYLRKLYVYLQYKQSERIGCIRRMVKNLVGLDQKQNKENCKNRNRNRNKQKLIIQQEPVLMQELYLQLKTINLLIEKYSIMRQDTIQAQHLFRKELQKLQLKYIQKQHLKLWTKDYNPHNESYLSHQNHTLRLCLTPATTIHSLSRTLRILSPTHLFFYSPQTSFIRHLSIQRIIGGIYGLEQLHTLYFVDSLESQRVVRVVKEQDEGFWGIGQERGKLGVYVERGEGRVQELVIEDEIAKKARMISMAAQTQLKTHQIPAQSKKISKYGISNSITIHRTILIDKRQFKSLLPSYLFHHGFKTIPVFLQTGDYILSNEVCIEKKSVHTRDLHESLKSGRLAEQVKKMCGRFAKPYLLIQCPEIASFRREEFVYGSVVGTGDRYGLNVRRQLIQIMNRYPKINILWSTSYMQTVKYIIQLKKNTQEPDINKFKPQIQKQEQLQIQFDNLLSKSHNDQQQQINKQLAQVSDIFKNRRSIKQRQQQQKQ